MWFFGLSSVQIIRVTVYASIFPQKQWGPYKCLLCDNFNVQNKNWLHTNFVAFTLTHALNGVFDFPIYYADAFLCCAIRRLHFYRRLFIASCLSSRISWIIKCSVVYSVWYITIGKSTWSLGRRRGIQPCQVSPWVIRSIQGAPLSGCTSWKNSCATSPSSSTHMELFLSLTNGVAVIHDCLSSGSFSYPSNHFIPQNNESNHGRAIMKPEFAYALPIVYFVTGCFWNRSPGTHRVVCEHCWNGLVVG